MADVVQYERYSCSHGYIRTAMSAFGVGVATSSSVVLTFLLMQGNMPCLFHHYLGVSCPGCGTTRAIHALFSGSLSESLRFNPALFVIGLPISIFLGRSIFHGRNLRRGVAIGLATAVVLYAVICNMSQIITD